MCILAVFFCNKKIIIWASISACRGVKDLSIATCKPSLRVDSSARTLVAVQTFLEKQTTHLPELSLIRPPSPAGPGFPRLELSVLSLKVPGGRGGDSEDRSKSWEF